jgi:hypothetical protein
MLRVHSPVVTRPCDLNYDTARGPGGPCSVVARSHGGFSDRWAPQTVVWEPEKKAVHAQRTEFEPNCGRWPPGTFADLLG